MMATQQALLCLLHILEPSPRSSSLLLALLLCTSPSLQTPVAQPPDFPLHLTVHFLSFARIFTNFLVVYAPGEITQCAGTKVLTAVSGSIQDHIGLVGYSHYEQNTTCGWQINAQPKSRVQIVFNSFDLVAGDTLTVFDGPSAAFPIIAVFTGGSPPPAVTSSTGTYMFLLFETVSNNTGTGFHLSWSSKWNSFQPIRVLTLVLDIGSAGFCQGTLMSTSATGNLQDHSDGGNYKGNQSCFWYIYPSNQNFGTYVVLSASSFNLAVGDYVAVYDGNSTSAPVVANVTGSLVTPYNFYASGVQMLVQFSSDINYSSTGFFMSWSTSAYPYVCSCLHAVSVTII